MQTQTHTHTHTDKPARRPAMPREGAAANLAQTFRDLPAPVRWAGAALGVLVAVRMLRGWRVWLPLAVQVWAASRTRA